MVYFHATRMRQSVHIPSEKSRRKNYPDNGLLTNYTGTTTWKLAVREGKKGNVEMDPGRPAA